MIRVVVDTNVIVSAMIKKTGNPAEILKRIHALEILPVVSREILTEYIEVLSRPAFKIPDGEIGALTIFFNRMLFNMPEIDLKKINAPEDDAIFVAAARYALADFIVTGNTRHYVGLKHEKFQILTPAEFLNRK